MINLKTYFQKTILNWNEYKSGHSEKVELGFWDTSPLFLKKNVFLFPQFLQDAHLMIYCFTCVSLINTQNISNFIQKTRKDRNSQSKHVSKFVGRFIFSFHFF